MDEIYLSEHVLFFPDFLGEAPEQTPPAKQLSMYTPELG